MKYEAPVVELVKFAAMETIADGVGGGDEPVEVSGEGEAF